VVRMYNPSQEPSSARVELDGAPARGWLVDLNGRPQRPFEGEIPLREWEIVSARLDR
jgi:hypothetical protein